MTGSSTITKHKQLKQHKRMRSTQMTEAAQTQNPWRMKQPIPVWRIRRKMRLTQPLTPPIILWA